MWSRLRDYTNFVVECLGVLVVLSVRDYDVTELNGA